VPTLFADPNNWIAVLATTLVVCLAVIVHYEVLGGAGRLLKLFDPRRRRRMILLIIIVLLAHIAEIWLFAFGYFGLAQFPGLGGLQGIAHVGLSEYAYYSAVVFTTLGFGDVIPFGAIRFMTGMEALTGLVLITWSASFAFLEMQRHWRFD
jgi:hypothetical protein